MARGRAGRGGAGGRARARGMWSRMRSNEYELATLIDLDRVQRLCDSLSSAFDIALAVLDTHGTVLIATGWQDICTRFHRENAETLRGCLESDLRINKRLIEGLGPAEHYRLPVQQRALGRGLPPVRRRRARRQHLHGAVLLRRRRRRPGGLRRAGAPAGLRRDRVSGGPCARTGDLPRASAEGDRLPRRLRRGPQRAGSRGPAAGAEARRAQGERGALPAPLRQRERGSHRVPRRARPGG